MAQSIRLNSSKIDYDRLAFRLGVLEHVWCSRDIGYIYTNEVGVSYDMRDCKAWRNAAQNGLEMDWPYIMQVCNGAYKELNHD